MTAAGCSGDPPSAVERKPASAAAPAGSRAMTVSVAPIEAQALDRTVEATGSLLAWEEVVLNTSIAGTISRLLVDLGDRVKAGQVVAEQDPREATLAVEQAEAGVGAARDSLQRARAQAQASLAQLEQVRASRRSMEANLNRTRAALEETRANLDRMRKLAAEALVAPRDLDVARTQYETAAAQHETSEVELTQFPDRVRVAEANLESDRSAVRVAESDLRRREADLALARKRLADVTLRAPITGAIARRHLNPGQYVTENTAVFTIVRTDLLKFTGTVPEHAALDLRPGQAVRVRVDPVPDRDFPGKVTRVSPAVDVASRTVTVEAEVPNPEGLLRPGLFARAAVLLRQDQAVAFVPEAAVAYFAGITKVYVVEDGVARERAVGLGTRKGGLIEVVRGVKAGEQVATSGLAQLHDGAAVTVAGAAAGAPAAGKPGAATR
ncbi:MAG TPA: efflux RND transporter periplasmic adaptor subunit [Methylomirabilota bacterium]|nr:efflux RND transporter periplasmic adaptor subunit [Methylomirabilota bacterium]